MIDYQLPPRCDACSTRSGGIVRHDGPCDAVGLTITIPSNSIRGSVPTVVSPNVHHPSHYGGADNPYEAIKVIENWQLGFCLGNTVKYIARAGKKQDAITDLEKARWYLDREIENLRAKVNG